MGTRLRSKVKSFKGTKTPIHGKNKLTLSVINTMQNFYGLAIRRNTGSLYAMKKAVAAILWHCTNYKDEAFRHRFCPRTKDSWCKWQLDKLNGTKLYKPHISLPKWIHDIILPIFKDLSSNDLLSKCLHGETQNTNEGFNSMVWQKCPKSIFVKRETLEMAINSAVMHFNDGKSGVLHLLNEFGIKPGKVSSSKTHKQDLSRVIVMNRKSSEPVRKRRKTLRSIKKGFEDEENQNEKPSYEKGGF